MDPITTITTIFPALAPYAGVAAGAIAICSAVSTMLPAPAANASGFYPVVYKTLNFVALNMGHATNAGAVHPEPAPPAPPTSVMMDVLSVAETGTTVAEDILRSKK